MTWRRGSGKRVGKTVLRNYPRRRPGDDGNGSRSGRGLPERNGRHSKRGRERRGAMLPLPLAFRPSVRLPEHRLSLCVFSVCSPLLCVLSSPLDPLLLHCQSSDEMRDYSSSSSDWYCNEEGRPSTILFFPTTQFSQRIVGSLIDHSQFLCEGKRSAVHTSIQGPSLPISLEEQVPHCAHL